jgi:hypothetical protein
MFLLGILIFKGLTARRVYKSFGVKGLRNYKAIYLCLFAELHLITFLPLHIILFTSVSEVKQIL